MSSRRVVAVGDVVGGQVRVKKSDPTVFADYNVVCDGGCRGNPGQMYGSYQIATKNGRSRIERLADLGHGTNNEAEYLTLLEAVRDILRRCQMARVPTKDFTLAIRCDSRLAVNQINGVWGINAEHLMPIFDQIHEELAHFQSWTLKWVPRAEVVAVLGH